MRGSHITLGNVVTSAGISVVQTQSNTASAPSTQTAAFNHATTTGNSLFALVAWGGTKPISTIATSGGTALVVDALPTIQTNSCACTIARLDNAASSTGITVTFAGIQSGYVLLMILEVSGLNSAGSLDKTGLYSGSVASGVAAPETVSTSAATTVANELILAVISNNTVPVYAPGTPSGYTNLGNYQESGGSGGNNSYEGAYMIVSTTGTYSATWATIPTSSTHTSYIDAAIATYHV